jgi:hypothetical protein
MTKVSPGQIRARQDEPLLKNVGRHARALGVSPVFVKRMRWAGFAMPGGVATVEWALEWLREHPEFRQADWTRPRRVAQHRQA